MRKIKNLIIISFIVLMIIGMGSVMLNVYSNITLKKSFKLAENSYQYEQAFEESSVDLKQISKVFPKIFAPIGYDYTKKIVSPVTVNYYNNINDTVPVYIIEKGETIYVNVPFSENSENEFQGIRTLPTNVNGWRFSVPFQTDSKQVNDLLYVKLSDIEEVSKSWLEINPKAKTAMRSSMKIMFPSKQDYIKMLTLSTDNVLYEKGVYLSLDLYKPVFSTFEYVVFVFALILILIYICMCKIKMQK